QDGVVRGLTLLSAMKSIEPSIKFLTAFRQCQGVVVCDIVAAAHEGIDRAQGFALAARQDEKCVVEILRRGAGDALAHGIRHDELGGSRSPGKGNLLRAGAHRCPPRLLPKTFAMAACATRASLRALEMAGRSPSTA